MLVVWDFLSSLYSKNAFNQITKQHFLQIRHHTVDLTHKMFLFAPNMQMQTETRETCNSNLYIHVLSNMCNSQKVLFLQRKIKYVIYLEDGIDISLS